MRGRHASVGFAAVEDEPVAGDEETGWLGRMARTG